MAKEKDNEKLSKYIRRIEAAENWRDSNYKEIWNACYKRWRNHVDPITDEHGNVIKDRSNISIPYTFTQAETILPRLVESIFASRPYVSVKGREPKDEANAKNMETLLDWQMNERMDIQDLFHSGLKMMVVYGTTIAYTGWKYKTKDMIKRVQMPMHQLDSTGEAILDENGEPVLLRDPYTNEPVMDWVTVETEEIVYDDPDVQFIDIGLFYVDPNATDIEDARYCGHVCFKTKSEIEEMAKWDEDMKLNWDEIPKESKKNTAKEDRMSMIGIGKQDENAHNDEMRLYEVHYYFEDDKEVIIINRGYVAKDAENPYWHKKKPYVRDTYTDVPGEFYGMGPVEMLEDLQDELNAERNMRIDYRAMSLLRMWKIRKDANIPPEHLLWRRNGVIPVENMDDLEPIEAPDSALSGSFSQENTIKQDMQDTSGAHDIIMGASGGNETATTTVTKDNNASMRFKLIISSIEKRLLVGITNLMMQLNQQFLDTEKVIRVTGESGEEWRTITPEDIQGEFDLIAVGSSVEPMANKEAFKQRMVELYSVVASDPFMAQFPEKRRNLLKKVYEAFDVRDVDDLLPSDEELQGAVAPPMQNPPNVGGSNTLMQEQGFPLSMIGG